MLPGMAFGKRAPKMPGMAFGKRAPKMPGMAFGKRGLHASMQRMCTVDS